jgi:hypothetical protein
MDTLLNADTLQYDDEVQETIAYKQPADMTSSKKKKSVPADSLSEEETCSLTSWVLQG